MLRLHLLNRKTRQRADPRRAFRFVPVGHVIDHQVTCVVSISSHPNIRHADLIHDITELSCLVNP